MVDPDRYFLFGPVLGCREPVQNSRVLRLPTVAREKLAGGCVLYRPLRFARRTHEMGPPNRMGWDLGEAQSRL